MVFGCGFLVFLMFWFNFDFGFKNPKPLPKSKFFWIPVSGHELEFLFFFRKVKVMTLT
jgi:hypothetical protein